LKGTIYPALQGPLIRDFSGSNGPAAVTFGGGNWCDQSLEGVLHKCVPNTFPWFICKNVCFFEVFGDCKKVGNFPLFLAAKGKPVLFSLGIKKIGNFPTDS